MLSPLSSPNSQPIRSAVSCVMLCDAVWCLCVLCEIFQIDPDRGSTVTDSGLNFLIIRRRIHFVFMSLLYSVEQYFELIVKTVTGLLQKPQTLAACRRLLPFLLHPHPKGCVGSVFRIQDKLPPWVPVKDIRSISCNLRLYRIVSNVILRMAYFF